PGQTISWPHLHKLAGTEVHPHRTGGSHRQRPQQDVARALAARTALKIAPADRRCGPTVRIVRGEGGIDGARVEQISGAVEHQRRRRARHQYVRCRRRDAAHSSQEAIERGRRIGRNRRRTDRDEKAGQRDQECHEHHGRRVATPIKISCHHHPRLAPRAILATNTMSMAALRRPAGLGMATPIFPIERPMPSYHTGAMGLATMRRMGDWTMAALPRRQAPAPSELSACPAPARVVPWETMALPALLAVCLVLRVVNLGALPIFFDEAGYTRAAQIAGTLPRPVLWLISLNYGAPPL